MSISTIFAYFADITPKEERTKYFGWISAIAGIGGGRLIPARAGNTSARLKNLTEAGFGIADEMARYRGLAIARGVTLSI